MRLVPDDVWAILTIWMEARGEPYRGKLAVAEVIRNRMQQQYASDGTMAGTVLRAEQFSGWNAHDPNRILAAQLSLGDPSVLACCEAWMEAQGTSAVACGAVLYHSSDCVAPPSWAARARVVAHIGKHLFYVPVEDPT